jgi:hypothetical protein
MGNQTFKASQNRKIAHAAFLPATYDQLCTRAFLNNRSIGGEIVDIVEKTLKGQEHTEQRQWSPAAAMEHK